MWRTCVPDGCGDKISFRQSFVRGLCFDCKLPWELEADCRRLVYAKVRGNKRLSLLPRLGQQAPRDQQRKQGNRRDGRESCCQAEVPGDQPGERGA